MLAKIAERHPTQFRACCGSNVDRQTRDVKVLQGRKTWRLDVAVDDMATALQTGKFVGMGEFLPRNLDRRHVYTFRERLDEVRRFMDLAAKYEVPIDWHEFTMHHGWDPYHQLSRIAREYPEVPIIVCHGGYSIGYYAMGADVVRKSCRYAGMADNIYLETGTWPAEYFKIPLKNPNVGATQLLWGGDYGNVPQYIVAQPGQDPPSFASSMKRWPRVVSYQTDWWGWSLHQIRQLREWVTQDEINLILGGNAAKIFKLPVPYERMFPEGRPDLWGIHWQKSIPFIPKEQIQYPDYP
jgi:predicted TIM-barrel fold metal-dependent hydrolase